MRNLTKRSNRRKSQAGSSLIELLIAGIVFLICMLGIVPLFMLAIGNNGRSKVDTTSTELAQSVIEQIVAVLAKGGPAQLQDCSSPPVAWIISVNPNSYALTADGSAIDFSQSTSPGDQHHMDFAVCGDNPTSNAVYDVRWRIDSMPHGVNLVTVSARPKNMPTARFAFSLPVTIRTYVAAQ